MSRTSNELPRLEPESSASANSAMAAKRDIVNETKGKSKKYRGVAGKTIKYKKKYFFIILIIISFLSLRPLHKVH